MSPVERTGARRAGSRRIVLAGAGHAHVPLLRAVRDRRVAGDAGVEDVHLVLVSPGDFWYSGLATGVVAGQYPRDRDRVDVGALCEAAGVRWVRDRMTAVDRVRGVVETAGGEALPFDALSLNVGSVPAGRRTPGMQRHAVPVKPIEGLTRLPERLRAARSDWPQARMPVVVVGGGATGCELALSLEARGRREGLDLAVTLVTRGDVLERFRVGARRAAAQEMVRRGIPILERSAVRAVEPDAVLLADGRRLQYALCVDASGVVPHPVLREVGLPLAEDGGLVVDRRLRSPADRRVFAAGDCASVAGERLARVGVHAVRQAPLLLGNLLATVGRGELRDWTPQRRYLLVLNLGERRGLAVRGRLHGVGRAAWRLKDLLDRRFLDA